MGRDGHDTTDDLPLILRIIKSKGGAADPEEVVRSMSDYGLGEKWSRHAIKEGISDGTLGIDLNWKLVAGKVAAKMNYDIPPVVVQLPCGCVPGADNQHHWSCSKFDGSPRLQELERECDELRTVVRHIRDWTHVHGAALKPVGADTYGNGMRDAKKQVAALLSADLKATTR